MYFIYFIDDRYGWTSIDNFFFLYIVRNENGKHVQYVLSNIAQTELFSKYFLRLHPKVCDCAYLQTYPVTETEAILFKEISSKNSNALNTITETNNSFIVELNDLKEYYTFLKSCFYKLTHRALPWCVTEKCGLIRINTDSVLPYCIIKERKYIPFFYFESKLKALKSLTIEVEKWSFTYIQFCYLVHGIKYDFSNLPSFLLINIDIIKNYFKSNVYFEEYWPACTKNLLNNNITNINLPALPPFHDTEITSPNLSPESNSIQYVSETNNTDTDIICKLVRVKRVINFI